MGWVELFLGPIIAKVIDAGFEYPKDHKEELERLRTNLPQIQAVVNYASILDHIEDKNPALNTWFWQLRDAIDEAEDVMEELTIKMEETEVRSAATSSLSGTVSKYRKIICQRALKNDPTLTKLEEVVKKLDRVSTGVATFFELAKEAKQEHQEQQLELNRARDTGSLPKNNVSIGRDDEKKFVMNWLEKTSNENQTTSYSNMSLLSIVGHGGMGKTTLLQQVYNEEMKNEFDLKMWACVSNDFNKHTIIKLILESATKDRSSLVAFDALQQTLKDTVNSKKYLLVLDDIWEEVDKEMNKSKWEDVLAPLAHGKLGSKILVTTRMENVAILLSNIIGKKNEMLRIEGLNDDECLQLLYNHAFNKGEDPTSYPKLRPIAERIVKKLSGSPLAAKVIGGVLSSGLNITHWNRVLNYNIGGQKDILDILKLSYLFLPKVLRNCYSFCCTFSQDYKFYKDNLVPMWIALGFIQPDNSRGETMKDVGERYFDTLVQISLFDKFESYFGRYKYYKLHDLLHEMLRTFSTQECCSIVGGDEGLLSTTPKTIRHLFAQHVNLAVLRKVMKEFKHLRSFILIDPKMHEDLVYMLAKLFKKLRSIRLIFIKADLKNIPKEIEDLIHLQYLKIDCKYEQSGQVSLPAFWRLPFLKYLFLYNIQEVKGFDYKFHGNEKIRVFPSLQVLHIEDLYSLKNLFIATEAAYECLFPCLTELHLYKCPNLLELIALSPKIEKLEIGCIFPSLQVLDIRVNEALEDWFVEKAAAYECVFPCLTTLTLRHCPKLLELPDVPGLLPKLEKLEVWNVKWKGSNWLQGISSNCNISIDCCPNLLSLKGDQVMETPEKCQLILSKLVINDPSLLLKVPLTSVTSIKELGIEFNDEIISFSIDGVKEWILKVSPSLCNLKFDSLELLQLLPSFSESISSLKSLKVSFIPLLQQLPNMPASLEKLFLYFLPQLRELPDLPPSLHVLEIWACHPDLKKRYQRDTSSDWHKIAHIPKVIYRC